MPSWRNWNRKQKPFTYPTIGSPFFGDWEGGEEGRQFYPISQGWHPIYFRIARDSNEFNRRTAFGSNMSGSLSAPLAGRFFNTRINRNTPDCDYMVETVPGVDPFVEADRILEAIAATTNAVSR